jgi:uncharacterized protein
MLRGYTLGLLLSILAPALLISCNVPAPGQKVESKGAGRETSAQDVEALLRSVKQGDVATTARLLSSGVSPNIRDASNVTPLMIAALRGDEEMTGILLNAGAEPNATSDTGDTALVKAISFEEIEVVKLLLKGGANPEVKHPLRGESALHVAARMANVEVINALLSKNIDVNLKDNDGVTPLMEAVGSRPGENLETIRVLLNKGADVNAVNNHGHTALMDAVGSIEAMKILLVHGADINARDNDGWTALEIALLGGCPDIIEMLEKAGAQE